MAVTIDCPVHWDPPPPALPPGPAQALWDHEGAQPVRCSGPIGAVFEVFFLAPDGKYLEVELAPCVRD